MVTEMCKCVIVLITVSFSLAALCPDKAKWNYPVFWIGLPGNYPCKLSAANGRPTTAKTILNCPYTRYPVTKTLNLNGFKAFRHSPTSSTRMPSSTGKDFHGCLVQSDNPIAPVVINKSGSHIGGTQFREMKELGLEYYIMTTNPIISTKPELVIMASITDTKVSVRLPLFRQISVIYGGTTYTNGDWINDTLKDFETMRISTNKMDLTGSYVVSDKPVAVVAGEYETKVQIGSTVVTGHVEESMPPVQELGRDYIAAPLIHENYTCSLRILAVSNDSDVTKVTISNTTDTVGFSVYISFNGVYDYDFNCELQLIRSNQDIMVGLFTQTGGIVGGKPAFFVLTPLEKAGNAAWFSVPDNYGLGLDHAFEHNYLNIIVKASDASGIRVNNAEIKSNFHQEIYVGSELYSAYSVSVGANSSNAYNVRHISSGKFIGYFEARKNDWRTYGYALIPYQQGPDFLFWDEKAHSVIADNITYNANRNLKNYDTEKNVQASSFDPSTSLVLTDTNKFVALNKCKKTSCDFVSCTETNTCTLSYTPHHCEVKNKVGSAVYRYSGVKEESCSAAPEKTWIINVDIGF